MKTGIVTDHQYRFDADGYGLEPGVKRLRAFEIETLVETDFGGMAVKAGRNKIKGLARSLRRKAEDELGTEFNSLRASPMTRAAPRPRSFRGRSKSSRSK